MTDLPQDNLFTHRLRAQREATLFGVSRAPANTKVSAMAGNAGGVVAVSDRPGYIYARLGGDADRLVIAKSAMGIPAAHQYISLIESKPGKLGSYEVTDFNPVGSLGSPGYIYASQVLLQPTVAGLPSAQSAIEYLNDQVTLIQSFVGGWGSPEWGNSGWGGNSPGTTLGPSSVTDAMLVNDKVNVVGDFMTGYLAMRGPQYDIRAYGAVGDGLYVADGSITSGTATLTSAEGAFLPAHQGKSIWVLGAGAAGGMLATTVLAYVSPTQLTLAANASTTIAALASPGAPTVTPLVGSGAFTAGNYNFSVSYMNARGETIPGAFTTATIAASGRAQVALPIGPAGTTARRVYRNTVPGGSSGHGAQFRIADVQDNTTTTFIDLGLSTSNWWPLKNTTGAACAWGTDNLTAITNAINDAKLVGGVVIAPGTGKGYLCSSYIYLEKGVTLSSGGRMGPSLGTHTPAKERGINYTREAEIWFVDNSGGTSFWGVYMEQNSSIVGMTFFYPCQFRSSPPVAYPPTIYSGGLTNNLTVRDCLFVNSYFGMKFDGAQNVTISDISMGALNTGLWMDQNYNTAKVRNYHYGSFWVDDSWVTNPLLAYIRANAKSAVLNRVDEFMATNWLIYGVTTGILLDNNGFGGGRGSFTNIDLDDVNIGIHLKESDRVGYNFNNLVIYALHGTTPRCVKAEAPAFSSSYNGGLKIENGWFFTDVSGGCGVELASSVTGTQPRFQFSDVDFYQWGSGGSDSAIKISTNNAYVSTTDCTFRTTTGYQFDLGGLTAGQNNPRIVTGCVFAGGKRINNPNNVMLHESGGWDSTLTGVAIGGATRLISNETTAVLELRDFGSSGGAGLRLIGNGVTTPTKTLRVYSGLFEIMNDAYTVSLFKVADNGGVTVPGFFGSPSITIDNALAVGGSLALMSQGNNFWGIQNDTGKLQFDLNGSTTTLEIRPVAVDVTGVLSVLGSSANLILNNSNADGADITFASSGFTSWNMDNASGAMRLHRGGTVYWQLSNAFSFVVGAGALATNATDAFLYFPGMPGAPSGTPSSFTGRYPYTWDSTNKRNWLYDGSWQLVGGKAPGTRVYNTGTVTVGHQSATPVAFPTEAFDTDALHDTATNNTRITFPFGGKYIVGGCVWWQSGSGGIRQVAIRLNGGNELHNDRKSGNYPVSVICQPTTIYDFSAGDYVELVCFQDSGASVNLDVVNPFAPSFWAIRASL